jgi:hypothetical protein
MASNIYHDMYARLRDAFPMCDPERVLAPLLLGLLGGANVLVLSRVANSDLASDLVAAAGGLVDDRVGPLFVLTPQLAAEHGTYLTGGPEVTTRVTRVGQSGATDVEVTTSRRLGVVPYDARLMILKELPCISSTGIIKYALGDEFGGGMRALWTHQGTVKMPNLLSVIATACSDRRYRRSVRTYSDEFAFYFDIGVVIDEPTLIERFCRDTKSDAAPMRPGMAKSWGDEAISDFRTCCAAVESDATDSTTTMISEACRRMGAAFQGTFLRLRLVAKARAAADGRAACREDDWRQALEFRERAWEFLVSGAH